MFIMVEEKAQVQDPLIIIYKLTKQYGGEGAIPDEELTKIGYRKLKIEDGWTLKKVIPTEAELRHKEKIERLKRVFETKMKKKAEQCPFARMDVSVQEREAAYRRIDEPSMKGLKKLLLDLAMYQNPLSSDFEDLAENAQPFLNNVLVLYDDFADFLTREYEEKLEIDELLYSLFNSWSFGLANGSFEGNALLPYSPDGNGLIEFLSQYTGDYEQGLEKTIPSTQCELLYQEIERYRGTLTDIPFKTAKFHQELQSSIDIDEEPQLDDAPMLIGYLSEHILSKKYGLISHFFGMYLSSLGLSEIGNGIQESTEPDEAIRILSSADFTSQLTAEERILKEQIKTATPEQRRSLSGRVKEIGEIKKRCKQIQNGLIEYYKTPVVLSQILANKINKIEDFLTTASHNSSHLNLTLDAAPDAMLDKNPGKTSGDCTEGAPLPFAEPDIPLYNTKVFLPDGRHIGNMYLLVDSLTSNEAVWHFDAIQIPVKSIDWSIAIPALIDRLGREAESKGVHAISVNMEDHHTSNYDYISQAVTDHWTSQGRKVATISKPQIPLDKSKRYSNFQGSDTVRILWSTDMGHFQEAKQSDNLEEH